MLHVHRAERADALADALAEVLQVPQADPFAPEVVAVPERGIERWLGQRLSHRLGTSPGRADGVCGGVEFPSPAALVSGAVYAATGTDPDDDPWHPARAVWPLLEIIDGSAGEAWCGTLGAHLRGPGRGRRYAVARRLAELFTGYAAHRADMLAAWAAGACTDGSHPLPADLRWQPELWRRLGVRLDGPGPAERVATAVEALRADPALADLPPRLSLFGPTRLPADQLAVLGALAAHRDVHLWLAHPSPALWDAVRPHPGTVVRRRGDPTADLAVHPLLRSLARDVRELQLRLPPGTDRHHPLPDPPATLLGRLHLDLRDDRAPDGRPLPGRPEERPLLHPADRSVQVHACHGADRQVEVLREVVLGLLAGDPTLEPRDVLVMCPDIEAFAPLISAAFGLVLGDGTADAGAELVHPGHRLQVRLADRALRQVNPLLDTAATLLELAGSRLTSSQVLDFAAAAPVRRRFRFDDDDLDRLAELVVRSGVRWGLDAEHRRPYRLEAFGQNTWSAGLDRMLLGVAVAEDDHEGEGWLGTALPLDDVDSGDVDLVGRFAELVDRLGAVLDGLTGERPLRGWTDALTHGLDVLTTTTTAADAWQVTRAHAELADLVRCGGPQADAVPLTPADARGLLADRLRDRPTRSNFRTGTLTVATLVPMRSVPHRVICLLGLDDQVFPRTGAPDGDDVLARDPRVGERDPRSEDRQLLLDAVRAATEHLVVLYSGADERTNARRPPAVPLGELLDTVDATVRTTDGRPAREHIVVRHPLQPFDIRNFAPGALGAAGPFSFDRAALAGALAGAAERRSPRRFVERPLPPAPDADPAAGTAAPVPVVQLEDLARFVEHPVKAFLRQRMGLTRFAEDGDPGDALPVELDALARWAVGDRLLRDRLAGHTLGRCVSAEWRRGALPPGALGTRLLDDVLVDVEPLVAAAGRCRTGSAAAASSVDLRAELPGGGPVVTGTVGGVHGDAVVRVEYSRLGPKHRLRAWVQLLALTVADPDRPWRALTLGRGHGGTACSVLGPLDRAIAARVLADVVALHRAGLREPLPIAGRTSHAYARTRLPRSSAARAAAAAEREWSGRAGCDGVDPAHELVWGVGAPASVLLAAPDGPVPFVLDTGTEPTRFGALAVGLWAPLLAAETLEEGS